jgi:Site-specific recombinase XerD
MLIEDYIAYIGKVRRYSPRTQEIYSDSLRLFCEYSEASSDASLLEALVPSVIRSFEVHLLDACKLDPRTVNLHLSVLSGFCRYLVRSGHLASNPVRLISRPKMEKRLPSFYREESMEEYFDRTESSASEENTELLTWR